MFVLIYEQFSPKGRACKNKILSLQCVVHQTIQTFDVFFFGCFVYVYLFIFKLFAIKKKKKSIC